MMNVDRHFPSAGNTVELGPRVHVHTVLSLYIKARSNAVLPVTLLSRPTLAHRFHRGFPSRANHSLRFLVNARPRHVANHADRLYTVTDIRVHYIPRIRTPLPIIF